MRVLVVEDDSELGTAVSAGLRSTGYAVDLARNGCEAAAKIDINRYDCLIVDRGLPDGDGLGLVRRVREAGSRVPVLVLTARDAVADRVAGFAEGADDYLVKPFAFAELAARVGALCRRAAQIRPVLVRIGDLELDVARRRVRRRGILLTLRAKEFAVLEALAARPGQVISRTELIECCWDEMAEPMSNVVDAVIAQLRRKLGPPPLIDTVRGVGFMLAGEPLDQPVRAPGEPGRPIGEPVGEPAGRPVRASGGEPVGGLAGEPVGGPSRVGRHGRRPFGRRS